MNSVSRSFVAVSFPSSHSRVSNASGTEEANFSIFGLPKFPSLNHIFSFLTPQGSSVFSDVCIYFSGAIPQSQSLIGSTKFPATASPRSKAFSSLTGSNTFVGESCLFFFHRPCYKHIKKGVLFIATTINYLSFLLLCTSSLNFSKFWHFNNKKKLELFSGLNCKSTYESIRKFYFLDN